MPSVVAILGRPNVGKSTLFNQLTRTRDALVADIAGMTRDRKFGVGRRGNRPYLVVDTGGIFGPDDALSRAVEEQAMQAAAEADHVILLTDAEDGVTNADEMLASRLRPLAERVTLVVNKIDGRDPDVVTAEFHALGLGTPVPVSARGGAGVDALAEHFLAALPDSDAELDQAGDSVRIAVLGRPNVGKSTLINRILGEARMVTSDVAGTTRDSVATPFERRGRNYLLIDTAGIRRRSRITDTVEKFSVVTSLKSVDMAHVVVLVLDAHEAITEQDASLLGLILDSGRALVIAVNKWDGLDDYAREQVRAQLSRKLHFIDFAETLFISALHGSGVGHLFEAVNRAWESAMRKPATGQVNAILERAVAAHPPPLVRGRRIKLRYAHVGGSNPPTIIVHGNQTVEVPASYQRYLAGCFRDALKLTGTPVRIEFRQSDNPFAGRRNKLNKRQLAKRKRMIKHRKS